MFKVNSLALSAALVASAARASAECTGVIATLPGTCDYATFVANLNDACNVTELFPEGPEATVAELCEYDAHVQFVEIQGTYQKDRRYFAGGGILVDGENYAIDSAQVSRFEANLRSGTIIDFPEYTARLQYNINKGLGTNGYPANMNLDSSCDLNTVMCCFTDGDFATNSDSTVDVCRHDLYDSPQSNHIEEGWSVFPGSESATHCVGFTWAEGDTFLLGNMMYDISLHQTATKGYKNGVPGAPMCGCIEHMPTVESAKCRTATLTGAVTYTFTYEDGYVSASNAATVNYADCPDPDLKTAALANGADPELLDDKLVGAGGCPDDLVDYLNDEQFLHVGQHLTKYVAPDPTKWSELVVGEGIYFQPPDEDPAVADAEFRGLIEAGCTDDDGNPRYCMVRRVCASCYSVPHRDIYYKRLTTLPPYGTNTTAGETYLLDMFMNNWANYPANDAAAGDFELYGSYEEAKLGVGKWNYYDYGNYDKYGFPRNSAPYSAVWNQWNSYVRSNGDANHHGFFVEKP